MNIIVLISFFIVSLVVLASAGGSNLFVALQNNYSATERVIIGFLLSIKVSLTLLLITAIFLPLLEILPVDAFFLYFFTGVLLIYYAWSFMYQRNNVSVNSKESLPFSSFIKEAWRLPIFPSIGSFFILLFFILTFKKLYYINSFNLVTLDFIVSILLGIIIICYDFIFNLLKQRGRVFFRCLLSILVFFIGIAYLIYSIK